MMILYLIIVIKIELEWLDILSFNMIIMMCLSHLPPILAIIPIQISLTTYCHPQLPFPIPHILPPLLHILQPIPLLWPYPPPLPSNPTLTPPSTHYKHITEWISTFSILSLHSILSII